MNYGKISREFIQRTKQQEQQILHKLKRIEQKQDTHETDDIKNVESKKATNNKNAKTTFYYAQQRLQQRRDDIALINRWYDLIDSDYDNICFYMCADEAKIDENVLQKISAIFPLIKTYPDLILDLCHTFPDPPKNIKDALDSSQLWNPSTKLVEEAFVFDEIAQNVLDPKYRYLINMDGNIIRRYLDDRTSVTFNQKINSELFMQLSNQSRWNNLWVQIGVSLFYMDTISQDKALVNTGWTFGNTRRVGTELITFRTICYILKKFKYLPFTYRPNGAIDISYGDGPWVTGIVPLLYSLLELSKEERGCNVLGDLLNVIIEYRITCAYTSFETETLDKKGIYSSYLKLITSNLQKYARYVYSRDFSQQKLSLYEGNVEIYINDDELNELKSKIKEKSYLPFFSLMSSYIKKLNTSDHVKNTERARWLMGVCLTMGNAGIYYKTSLVLEKEKSVASQTLGTLNFPKPAVNWVFNDMKIDCCTNWDSGDVMYREIEKRYKKDAMIHIDKLNVNMHEWFYTLLTNKSQGFKVDVEKFVVDMNIDQELLKDLRNVGQVRVASFLLDNETFGIFSKYADTLSLDGVCTIRFQNNRRARIVEIVPNVDQIGYAIILRIFEEMKSDIPQMAVGKQIGGVVDMSLQLRISSLQNGLSIFSDVSAMDAHTQPNVAVMFLKMLSEVIQEYDIGPTTYFPFKTEDAIVEHTEYSSVTNKVEYDRKKIPALAKTLLFIASQRLNKRYLLKDSIFNTSIEINPTIFESGRFDTSAQHTKLLKYAADVVYEKIRNALPEAAGKYFSDQRKFGDDSYEYLEFVGLDDTTKRRLIDSIIAYTDESLYQVGLKAETEMSAYYGDFLQQMAFCGVVIPKSARSSIYTDEKGALLSRDVIDLITNLANIITASAQRTYAPQNVMSLVRNIWAANRNFRLLPSKALRIVDELKPFIKQFGERFYLEYPYLLINLPPLNFPNQTYVISDFILPRSSLLRTVGHCKLNFIWNECFSKNELDALFETSSNLLDVGKIVNVFKFFIEKTKGTGIYESLLLSSYKRSQQLQKTRYERLSDAIIKMGKVAENYFDETALRVSASSAMVLKNTFGITLPDNLLYYMKPIEQLKNMFETRGESSDESLGLNDYFILYMNKIFTTPPEEIVDMIINTCVIWQSTGFADVHIYNENGILPIMPGYVLNSDYYNAQCLVGNALRMKQRVNKALVSFTTRYGGTYNMEAIQKFGTKAKTAGTKDNQVAFELFLSAMQLPKRIRLAVEEMFAASETLLLNDLYKSGFQPEQMFSISDSTMNISTMMEFKHQYNTQVRNTLQLMYRDYLFLTCHRQTPKTIVSPILAPATYIKYNLKSYLAKVGINSL